MNGNTFSYRIGTLEVSPEHPLVRRVHAQLLVQQTLQKRLRLSFVHCGPSSMYWPSNRVRRRLLPTGESPREIQRPTNGRLWILLSLHVLRGELGWMIFLSALWSWARSNSKVTMGKVLRSVQAGQGTGSEWMMTASAWGLSKAL